MIVSGTLQALQLIAIGLLEEGFIVLQKQSSYLNSVHLFQSNGMRMISVSREIVAHWISSGLYEKHLITFCKQLKKRATFVEKLLEQQFQKIATWKNSEGGLYIWFQFHKPIVNKDLFLKLL